MQLSVSMLVRRSGKTASMRRSLLISAACGLCAFNTPAHAQGSLGSAPARSAPAAVRTKAISFNIPGQDLQSALQALTRQAGVQLVVNPAHVRGLKSSPVVGRHSPDRALRIMLHSLPIRVEWVGNDTLVIERMAAALRPTGIAASAQAPATASVAAREPEQAPELEEIVVTAQKRAEPLQRIPLSATALGSDQLQALGVSSINDLTSGGIPSLRIVPLSGRASSFNVAMRGISSGDAAQISREPGVAIYIDGVYLGRVQGLGSELFEIERMEVLRGPQGTLFGRNAVGGALNIISKKPTGEFSLDQHIEVSNFDGRGLVTHLNLPAIAGVAVKIDGVLKRRDGWVRNSLRGAKDWGGYSRRGIRASALWQPTDDISLLYSFDKSRDATVGGYAHIGDFLDAASHQLGPLIQLEPRRVTHSRLGAPMEPSIGKVTGHSLTANALLSENIEVKSITAYRKLSQTTYDQAAGNFHGFSPNGFFGRTSLADVNQDQFSQEFQVIGSLNRLKYTLGAFYFDEDADDEAYAFRILKWNATGTDYTILSSPVGGTPPDRASVNHSKSSALYGQLAFNPPIAGDRLHVTAGLRYTNDKKRGAVTTLRGAPAPASQAYKFSSSRVDPSASLSVDISNAAQAYLRWGVGYRAGGANSRSATFRAFGEEEVENWEVGLKTQFWNRRARLNVALFDMSYRDIQLDLVNPATPSNIETINATGTAKIKGMEVDAALRPIPGLTLEGSYTYLKYKIPLTLNPFTGQSSRVNLTYAPRHAAAGSIDYRLTETKFGTPFVHFDASYGSPSYSFPGDTHKTESYFLVNGRIGVDQTDIGPGHLSIAFWVKNIFNEQHITSLFELRSAGTTNSVFSYYNLPRTYGIQIVSKF